MACGYYWWKWRNSNKSVWLYFIIIAKTCFIYNTVIRYDLIENMCRCVYYFILIKCIIFEYKNQSLIKKPITFN